VACPRCVRLRAEVDAAAPEREQLQRQYLAAHPAPPPKPPVLRDQQRLGAPTTDEEDDL
jgi:hypothetical protein